MKHNIICDSNVIQNVTNDKSKFYLSFWFLFQCLTWCNLARFTFSLLLDHLLARVSFLTTKFTLSDSCVSRVLFSAILKVREYFFFFLLAIDSMLKWFQWMNCLVINCFVHSRSSEDIFWTDICRLGDT